MKGLFVHDTEADGLLEEATKYHCSLFKEYNQNNWVLFLDPDHEEYQQAVDFAMAKEVNLRILDYKDFANWLTTEPRALACHNQFSYDLRLWRKLSGITFDMFRDPGCRGTINEKQVDLYDTLSMSRLLYPDRPLPNGCPTKVKCPVTGKMKTVGPHGLEAWGFRVANKKVQIDNWVDQPLWTYVDRVFEDVVINERVWAELILESQGRKIPGDIQFFYKEKATGNQQINWKNGLRRGMVADFLMCEQEEQGVCFKREEAKALVVRIDGMMKEIADEVEPQLPPKEMSKSKQPTFPSKPFKEGNGEISSTGWNWLEQQLGYPVNREALEHMAPPKTAFKQDGSISVAGENYCKKHGVENSEEFADFIRSQLHKENTLKPLPDHLMEQAVEDLRTQKMPNLMEPMKLGNQDDIKKFLIREAGWEPTIWRSKDVTKDSNKKQRPENEVDEKVREYLLDLANSEYLDLILRYLGITHKQFMNKDKMYKLFRRRARQLPTSPQLKDQRKALCPNLERVDGKLAKQIVLWLSLRNRRSVLDPIDEDKNDTGLLNHPRLDIDGKLPARSSGRTNTFRMKHQICANMPKAEEGVILGKEMRDLWTVPDGYYMLGVDGSNLEGMIAAAGAFEFDGGEYLRRMESGDAHTLNAVAYTQAAGREVSRTSGKSITYGIMYGAQAAKIAVMLGISMEAAQRVIDAFWDNNPGLKARREWLEKFWEATGKTYIPTFDGRKVYTRSKHSLLNAYQQASGAVLMDLAGILIHWEIVKNGMYDDDVRRIIYYHDEFEFQLKNQYVTVREFDTVTQAKAYQQELLSKGHRLEAHPVEEKVEDEEGNTTYVPILNKNGKIQVLHSVLGDIVVKCIEKAARMMKLPVKITGEYNLGYSWKDVH